MQYRYACQKIEAEVSRSHREFDILTGMLQYRFQRWGNCRLIDKRKYTWCVPSVKVKLAQMSSPIRELQTHFFDSAFQTFNGIDGRNIDTCRASLDARDTHDAPSASLDTRAHAQACVRARARRTGSRPPRYMHAALAWQQAGGGQPVAGQGRLFLAPSLSLCQLYFISRAYIYYETPV